MKVEFPKWKVNGIDNLKKLCANMDEQAIDLLAKMVVLEPSKRISAKEALLHPYFSDMDKENARPNQI